MGTQGGVPGHGELLFLRLVLILSLLRANGLTVASASELRVLRALGTEYVSRSALERRLDMPIDLELGSLSERGLVEGLSLSGVRKDHFKITEKGIRFMDGLLLSERDRCGEGSSEHLAADGPTDRVVMHHRRGVPWRILLVDDSTEITVPLKMGLERAGFDVESFNDPEEALAHVQAGKKYDLALFDVRMPKMDGFELYRRFRKVDDRAEVCFVTGMDISSKEFWNLFPDVKPKALLTKPISIADVTRVLDELAGGDAET